MNKISIVVPVYNTAEYLPKCLDSLIGQTYQNIEIICVNDGSTDHSLEVLEQYREKSDLIHVINQSNTGVSGARNAGISHASGDYLMFVDSDDWVDINICEVLLGKAIENDADCVMCSYCKEYGNRDIVNHVFSSNIIWDEKKTRDLFYRRLFGPVGEETARPHEVDIIVSPCMQLFRMSICREVQFIDTKKIGTEDCLYQIMVYKNCKKFIYVDQALYHYRKTNDSSLTTKYNPFLFDRWQNMYAVMEKIIMDEQYPRIYHDALQNRILFGLIGLGLNEVAADKSIYDKAKRLRYIVSGERYKKAFEGLTVKFMPMPWKVFYLLLKEKHTLPVVLMLQIIQLYRGK